MEEIIKHLNLGYVAIVIAFISLAIKNENKTKVILAFACIVWASYFFLKENHASAIVMLIMGVFTVNTIILKTIRSKHIVFVLYTTLLVIATVMAGSESKNIFTLESMIPMLAGINSIYAFSYLDNLSMRKQILLSSALWATNGVITDSTPQIISEILLSSINLKTIYQMLPQNPAIHGRHIRQRLNTCLKYLFNI